MTIAGIDPGSRRTALVVGESLPPGAPYRVRLTCPPEVATMTTAADDEIAVVAAGIVLRCRSHGVTAARLEWIFRPYIPKTAGPAEAAARMRAGLEMMRLAERIDRELTSIGIAVVRVANYSWRSRMFAFAKEIGVYLPPFRNRSPEFGFFLARHVEGWSATSGEDMRDAGGLLLAACLPDPAKAPARRKAGAHVAPEEDKRRRYHAGERRERATVAPPTQLDRVLAIVAEDGPRTAQEVADRLGIATPTAAVYLHKLNQRGYLNRIARGAYVLR